MTSTSEAGTLRSVEGNTLVIAAAVSAVTVVQGRREGWDVVVLHPGGSHCVGQHARREDVDQHQVRLCQQIQRRPDRE